MDFKDIERGDVFDLEPSPYSRPKIRVCVGGPEVFGAKQALFKYLIGLPNTGQIIGHKNGLYKPFFLTEFQLNRWKDEGAKPVLLSKIEPSKVDPDYLNQAIVREFKKIIEFMHLLYEMGNEK